MKAKVYSWEEVDSEGLLNVRVDEEMAKVVISRIEKEISNSVLERDFERAEDLISDRNVLVSSLALFDQGNEQKCEDSE